jgi:xanthine dehydrogenase accessory factor
MKEIQSILAYYYKVKPEANISMALATVVRVEGSSYRRTGARMLVCEDGNWVGGISGGCLEGDALKRAKVAILKESPSIITYDTSQKDEHQIGVGLGCNGIIDVLFLPINFNDEANPMEVLARAVLDSLRLITVCKVPDQKLSLGKICTVTSANDLRFLEEYLNPDAFFETITTFQKSQNVFFENGLHLFVEIIPKNKTLLLFGNQYDIYPLIQLAEFLAWNIKIVSEPNKLKEHVRGYAVSIEGIDVNDFAQNTAAILMSHSLETDKKNLKLLLDSNVSYLGMLGPKVRSEQILTEIKSEGILINDDLLTNIYAPVGLDIGANSPEEIALSIVSEINAVFSNRNADKLRNREMPINERTKPMFFK